MLESDIRRWIIYESTDRWHRAARQFGPSMTPQPLVLDVVEAATQPVSDFLIPAMPAVVIWEARPDQLADTAKRLRQTNADYPQLLQMVADGGLTARERLLLCEFPASIILQHPEHLPRLHPMIKGHFASASQPVD